MKLASKYGKIFAIITPNVLITGQFSKWNRTLQLVAVILGAANTMLHWAFTEYFFEVWGNTYSKACYLYSLAIDVHGGLLLLLLHASAPVIWRIFCAWCTSRAATVEFSFSSKIYSLHEPWPDRLAYNFLLSKRYISLRSVEDWKTYMAFGLRSVTGRRFRRSFVPPWVTQ